MQRHRTKLWSHPCRYLHPIQPSLQVPPRGNLFQGLCRRARCQGQGRRSEMSSPTAQIRRPAVISPAWGSSRPTAGTSNRCNDQNRQITTFSQIKLSLQARSDLAITQTQTYSQHQTAALHTSILVRQLREPRLVQFRHPNLSSSSLLSVALMFQGVCTGPLTTSRTTRVREAELRIERLALQTHPPLRVCVIKV